MNTPRERLEEAEAKVERLEKFIKTVGRWRSACWEYDDEVSQQRRRFADAKEWAYLELVARDEASKGGGK